MYCQIYPPSGWLCILVWEVVELVIYAELTKERLARRHQRVDRCTLTCSEWISPISGWSRHIKASTGWAFGLLLGLNWQAMLEDMSKPHSATQQHMNGLLSPGRSSLQWYMIVRLVYTVLCKLKSTEAECPSIDTLPQTLVWAKSDVCQCTVTSRSLRCGHRIFACNRWTFDKKNTTKLNLESRYIQSTQPEGQTHISCNYVPANNCTSGLPSTCLSSHHLQIRHRLLNRIMP